MSARIGWCLLVGALLLSQAQATPAMKLGEEAAVRGVLARVVPRARLQEPRLPLPSPQEVDAIKKVAEILVMLGQQVIPNIVGGGGAAPGAGGAGGVTGGGCLCDASSDPVNDN